ncbi:MAG: hypothetical protein RLO80_05620 [Hyphomonas sp.]
MHPIRLFLASLAFTAVLAAPAALADDLCDKVDALILSGQQDVSFADVFQPRPNELRNDNVYSGDALLGLFSKCTVIDEIDKVGRGSTVLSCSVTEAEDGVVTEESRKAFVANEFVRHQAISACIAAKEGWGSYGDLATGGSFNAFLETEAQTRLEDAISAELGVVPMGSAPLYRVMLMMNLRTTPRDYR